MEVKGGDGIREREGPPVITVPPGSRGARIVTVHLLVLPLMINSWWKTGFANALAAS